MYLAIHLIQGDQYNTRYYVCFAFFFKQFCFLFMHFFSKPKSHETSGKSVSKRENVKSDCGFFSHEGEKKLSNTFFTTNGCATVVGKIGRIHKVIGIISVWIGANENRFWMVVWLNLFNTLVPRLLSKLKRKSINDLI